MRLPVRLPDDAPLFDVPDGLVRVFNRDLRVAGIPKHDDRGRVLDIHSLRHTFGTHLSKGGVAPRVAQAAMRHSTLELTMNTYTDPRLLDVAGALDVLPTLPLDDRPEAQQAKATGTDDRVYLGPNLGPTFGKTCTQGARTDTTGDERVSSGIAASVTTDTSCGTMSHRVTQRAMGFEPTTSSLGSWHSTTELRPHPYFLHDKGLTRQSQDPVAYRSVALSPFGYGYLPANFQITSSLPNKPGRSPGYP